MSFWPRHLLLRWEGEFRDTNGSKVEEWSFGIRFVSAVRGNLPEQALGDVAPLLPQITTEEVAEWIKDPGGAESGTINDPLYWATRTLMSTLIHPQVACTALTAAILVNGPGNRPKYESPTSVVVRDFGASGVQGRGNSNTAFLHPPQISVVASLGTPATKGYAHRGRIFLPGPSAEVGATWGLNGTERQNYADSVRDALNIINAFPFYNSPVEPAPYIVGAIVSPYGVAGTMRPITRVEVGSVFDTQQRRRRGMRETYTVSATNASQLGT